MPHVTVKLLPGRTEQQKARLATAIVKDVVTLYKKPGYDRPKERT